MNNPGSPYMGLVVGGVFLLIALCQICWNKQDNTCDGMVEDKRIKTKTERESYEDDVR